jgi:hypothetical protein
MQVGPASGSSMDRPLVRGAGTPRSFTRCLSDTSLQSSHVGVSSRQVAESAFADRILADLLSRRFGIRSRHSTPRGSLHPFRVEHVVSYPVRYSPAFAFSAIHYLLAIRTLCSVLTDRLIRAEVNRLTEFHDDDTVGRVLPIYRRCYVSVSRGVSETSDRLPIWLRRVKLLSPVDTHDSYGSSPEFTRPLSLDPHPPVAGRIRGHASRSDLATCAGVHCQDALDGSLRRPP